MAQSYKFGFGIPYVTLPEPGEVTPSGKPYKYTVHFKTISTTSETTYNLALQFLAAVQQVLDYYNAHKHEEDAVDHTYQLLERTLKTIPYKEHPKNLNNMIGLTQHHFKDHKIITEYFDYILYCMKKESEVME